MTRASVRGSGARAAAQVRPERPFARFRWTVTVVLLALLAWSTWSVDATWGRLLQAPGRAVGFVGTLVETASLEPLGVALEAMWESIAIAWIATLLGAALSFPLVFLAAANLTRSRVRQPVRQVLNVFRAIPEIVLAIALIPFLGLGPVTGAVAMGISSIGTLGKLSAEIVESIDDGPLQAVEASGGGRLERLRWAVLPQAMPEIAAFWLYRFEINIRVSAVLGVIGIGGIGGFIAQAVERNVFERIGLGLLVVILATMLVDAISSRLRRRLIEGPSPAAQARRERASTGGGPTGDDAA